MFLINSLPSSVLSGLSPFEKLFSKKQYYFFQPFECAYFPHLRLYLSHKLNFRSEKCVFIGYSLTHKGYLCLNSVGRVYISRNVVFHPLDFPSRHCTSLSLSPIVPPSSLPQPHLPLLLHSISLPRPTHLHLL